jgi:hydroxyacylglutathione hydrolase
MPYQEIAKDLFFIERGFLNSNHFVYRSDSPILIDTGYATHFKDTWRIISGLGVDPARTRMILNTHTHCDHIGGNKKIQEVSGCDIALHRIGKHFIDTRDDWSTWWRYYDQEAGFFDCAMGLEDGDLIEIGPHVFRVIHTPGHASDGIVLYHAKEKVLISSDTLWEKDLAVITTRIEGSAAVFHCLESLEKLEGLEVRAVYPGHGKPFTDLNSALAYSRRRYEKYLGDRISLANDQLKRITIYTMLMAVSLKEEGLFNRLKATHWFKETVDLHFNGEYEMVFNRILKELMDKKIVASDNGLLHTTVKP